MRHNHILLNGTDDISDKPMVLKEWAYEHIKRRILDRKFPPGTALIIKDLQNEMNISSTPIRDALHRLEAEGLVQMRPRLSFYVSEITPDDLRNLFDLRVLIEGFAAERAASMLSNEDLDELGRLFDGCQFMGGAEFAREFQFNDQKFHSIIIESNRNPHLLQIIDMLQDLTHREQALGTTSFSNVQKSCEEHKQILTALIQRDGKEAGRCMRHHLTSVMERLLEILDSPNEE